MSVVEVIKAINSSDVADRGAVELAQFIRKLQSKQERIDVALTGGSVGILTLKHFAEKTDLSELDLNRVHFWFGDERYVALHSPDRNANQARETMLSKLGISPSNVHEFPAADSGLTVSQAAEVFESELATELGSESMDFMFLGMGTDGHVASLFPGHQYPDSVIVSEENSPKPPDQRLSMSYGFINRSKEIVFVVSGIDKSEAILDVHKNIHSELPAAKIRATEKTLWIIDAAAGAAFWSC